MKNSRVKQSKYIKIKDKLQMFQQKNSHDNFVFQALPKMNTSSPSPINNSDIISPSQLKTTLSFQDEVIDLEKQSQKQEKKQPQTISLGLPYFQNNVVNYKPKIETGIEMNKVDYDCTFNPQEIRTILINGIENYYKINGHYVRQPRHPILQQSSNVMWSIDKQIKIMKNPQNSRRTYCLHYQICIYWIQCPQFIIQRDQGLNKFEMPSHSTDVYIHQIINQHYDEYGKVVKIADEFISHELGTIHVESKIYIKVLQMPQQYECDCYFDNLMAKCLKVRKGNVELQWEEDICLKSIILSQSVSIYGYKINIDKTLRKNVLVNFYGCSPTPDTIEYLKRVNKIQFEDIQTIFTREATFIRCKI